MTLSIGARDLYQTTSSAGKRQQSAMRCLVRGRGVIAGMASWHHPGPVARVEALHRCQVSRRDDRASAALPSLEALTGHVLISVVQPWHLRRSRDINAAGGPEAH